MRTPPDLTDDEQLRRYFAVEALLTMLDNGGERSAKVAGAVKYADELVAELRRTRKP